MSRFDKHERKDRIKWTITFLVVAALIVGFFAIVTKGFKETDPKKWFSNEEVEYGGEEVEYGGFELFSSTYLSYINSPELYTVEYNSENFSFNVGLDRHDSGIDFLVSVVFNGTECYSNQFYYYSFAKGIRRYWEFDGLYQTDYANIPVSFFYPDFSIDNMGDYTFTFSYATSPTNYSQWLFDHICTVSFSVLRYEEVPSAPSKLGYTFCGWYYDSAFTQPCTEDKVIEGTQLYPKFEPIQYNIVYNVNNGSVNGKKTYNIEEKYVLPTPVRAGYTFLGWYDNVYFSGEKITEIPKGSMGDKVFFAKWQAIVKMVIFETNGGSLIDSVYVNVGDKILPPIAPTQENKVFDCWCSDEALTQKFDFNSSISENIVLYARWINIYTVSFNSNGGTYIESLKVVDGDTFSISTIPIKSNKVFDYWCLDETLTQKYDFNSPVISNITLYAKWLDMCTVTFDTNGGSVIEPFQVAEGELVPVPNIPTCAGKGFNGWYIDRTLINEFTFDTPIFSDITLYASWNSDYVIVRYIIIPLKQEQEVLVARNSKIYSLPTPKLYGYVFGGWFTDAGTFENEYDFTKPVQTDLKLYVRWDIDYIPVSVDKRDDSKIQTVEVQRGKTLALDEPTRVGYTFQGWFTDEDLTVEFDPETAIESPFRVYAKWLKNTDKPTEVDQIKDELNNISNNVKEHANKISDFFKKNWYWFVVGIGGVGAVALVVAIILEVKKKNGKG